MATKEMCIKLMIDPESNKLIFAEASKDFVDFLIHILSLPIATVTNLLSNESSMVGSIGNVYTSVTNFDETHLQPNVTKNTILNPMFFPSTINTPLSLTRPSPKFYTCFEPRCKRGITNVAFGAHCPGCREDLYNEIQFIDKDSSHGYVQDTVSYMVSDDLSVTSISTMSIVSMLNKFNVTKPEQQVVKIGNEEALELLKASLQSTTVLSDVFLKSKKRTQPLVHESNLCESKIVGNEERKISFCVRTQSGNNIFFAVRPSCTVFKVMVGVEKVEGISPKHQKLIFDGFRLQPERTFADYNVVDGSDIYLMLSQRGC